MKSFNCSAPARKFKVLTIFCFILISLSVFIAYTNPAKGYEPSIYKSTPPLVWIFLIISILGGLTLIVHQVYSKEYESNNFWLFGFLILIFFVVWSLSPRLDPFEGHHRKLNLKAISF